MNSLGSNKETVVIPYNHSEEYHCHNPWSHRQKRLHLWRLFPHPCCHCVDRRSLSLHFPLSSLSPTTFLALRGTQIFQSLKCFPEKDDLRSRSLIPTISDGVGYQSSERRHATASSWLASLRDFIFCFHGSGGNRCTLVSGLRWGSGRIWAVAWRLGWASQLLSPHPTHPKETFGFNSWIRLRIWAQF